MPHITVLWAQHSNAVDISKNIIYLTINVSEIREQTLHCDLTSNTLSFSGTNAKGASFAVDLDFYDEIDPAESKQHLTSRGLELVIRKKKAKAEFWPRLLKEAKKQHFLKTDFDKVAYPLLQFATQHSLLLMSLSVATNTF